MAKIDSLSVFLPAFNEEKNIKNTIVAVKNTLLKVVSTWEIIIVNDGSEDKTKEIVESLVKGDSRFRLINHVVNRGYGASLKSGFYNAKYSWIAFIDADGQFDFSEIMNFLKKQEDTGADLVIGYYKKRKVSFFKIVTSKAWEFLVYLLFGLKIKDIDCGFKLISRKVVEKIPKLESERGAFISSEFLIKAKKAGFKVVEISVTHFPATRVGTGRKLNVIVKSFVDLIKLWGKL
ncbi:MAG: glycosyltransferase family 2 protein [Patescibacteria group bacterium]